MSVVEKVRKWQDIDQAKEPEGFVVPQPPSMDSLAISSHEDTENEDARTIPSLSDIQAYIDLIQSDLAYSKLLSDVHREYMVVSTFPNILEDVSNSIYRMLPVSTQISRRRPPERFIMTFKVDWDPLEFLKQEYSEPSQTKIGNIIVLTGSTDMAQALTCSEYLRQTWPCSGRKIMNLIEKHIKTTWPFRLSCKPSFSKFIMMATNAYLKANCQMTQRLRVSRKSPKIPERELFMLQ